jgi:hypothetical protein
MPHELPDDLGYEVARGARTSRIPVVQALSSLVPSCTHSTVYDDVPVLEYKYSYVPCTQLLRVQ